jgi:hypothetical protein
VATLISAQPCDSKPSSQLVRSFEDPMDPTLNRRLAVHSFIPDIRAALLQKSGLAHVCRRRSKGIRS